MLEALADAPGDNVRDVAEEIGEKGRRFGVEGGERGRCYVELTYLTAAGLLHICIVQHRNKHVL